MGANNDADLLALTKPTLVARIRQLEAELASLTNANNKPAAAPQISPSLVLEQAAKATKLMVKGIRAQMKVSFTPSLSPSRI